MAGEKKPTPTPKPTSTLPPSLAEAAAGIGLTPEDLAAAKALAGSKTTTSTSTKKYEPYGQQTIYTPTKAKAFVRDQFKALFDREPTAAEVKTWVSKLRTKQKEASSAAITKYKMVDGVRIAVTETGLDEAQWLADQFATDKVLGAELTKKGTQAPGLADLAANKKIYDDLIKAAKGDSNKIKEINETTVYGRSLAEYTADISDQIQKSGAANDFASAENIAKYLLDRGLNINSEAAKSYIESQFKFGKGKKTIAGKTVEGFTGEAGSNVEALNKVALANGLTLDSVFDQVALDEVLSGINAGEDINTYAKMIRDAAKVAWNVSDNVAKLMDQGVSLDSIYGTYKRAYADTLELDPNTVTLKDLASMGVIGQPSKDSQAPQNLYDFQKALRKDDRWQYTQQANQEVASATQKILQDFGFMG